MKNVFILEGLDCANCAAKVERAVSAIDGVTNVSVNFITTKLTFDTETDDKALLNTIKKAAKKADPDITVKMA